MYSVKEVFLTLQGEGAHTGRPAVFCRFAGCNLWSGREADRAQAICKFCDTDFVGTDGDGGDQFSDARALADKIDEIWVSGKRVGARAHLSKSKFVVLTGGEPMLQVDEALVDALHTKGFEVAIETNGTIPVVKKIDWICVSPKAGAPIVQTTGDELKLVHPQDGLSPQTFEHLDFRHFFLQPMDGSDIKPNTDLTIDYCKSHPVWQLSLQTHKLLGFR